MAMGRTGNHLRIAFSSRFAARLHPVEYVLDEIVEHRGVELVDDLLSLALRKHEVGVAKLREMTRYRRPRRREVLGDLTRRARSVAQQAQDLAPRWIGQGSECVVHGRDLGC